MHVTRFNKHDHTVALNLIKGIILRSSSPNKIRRYMQRRRSLAEPMLIGGAHTQN